MRDARCGIYAIRHKSSGRVYIGGSRDMVGRFTWHRHALRNGYHGSKILLALWQTDGEDAFEFVEIEECMPEDLRDREMYWQNQFSGSLLSDHTARGYKLSATHKARISESHRRRQA